MMKITVDKVAMVMKNIAKLERRRVYVGIPAAQNARLDDNLNNATLGYIHEFGSPARNIPARPFLIPGVKAAQDKTIGILGEGAKNALSEKGNIESSLTKAGIVASNSVKNTINTADGFAPLSDATLLARAKRGVKRTKPLVDTGQLRNSITYIVKET